MIINAQKRAVMISPYQDARQRFDVHPLQSSFRLTKFPAPVRNLLSNTVRLTDTLWIAETFDDMCPSCSSFAAEIIYKDTLYHYSEMGGDTTSSRKFATLNLMNSKTTKSHIITAVVDSVRNGHGWLTNPLTYGSDHCADGDHTLVTVIYPDYRIEAMYVRCWGFHP